MTSKGPKLDEEELQILRDFERGEFESIRNFREEKRKLEEAARNTLQKDRRINIRISSRDLEQIRKRAAKEGIPYQTLISSTLHKLVSGKLKEVCGDYNDDGAVNIIDLYLKVWDVKIEFIIWIIECWLPDMGYPTSLKDLDKVIRDFPE